MEMEKGSLYFGWWIFVGLGVVGFGLFSEKGMESKERFVSFNRDLEFL